MMRIEIKTDEYMIDDKESELASVLREIADLIECDTIEEDIPFTIDIRDWNGKIVYSDTL